MTVVEGGERLTLRRRDLLGIAAALGVSGPLRAALPTTSYDGTVIIDMLGSLDEPFDMNAKAGLVRSGLTAISATMGQVGNGNDRYVSLIDDIAHTRGLIEANPDMLRLVLKAADITTCKAAKLTGVILNAQDTTWIGTDLGRIAAAKTLGLRIVQLTYNVQNLVADGAIEPNDGGLSIFGRRVMAELEHQKLAVDLSHGGRRTMAEAVAGATRPPIISHTGCRAVAEHPRNTDDATLRAVAAKGGFVGIYFMPYLSPGRICTANDVIRHIEHAFQICGEDHIGIGTDGAVRPQVADKAYRDEMIRIEAERTAAGIAAPGDTADTLLFVPELNGPDKFRRLADLLAQRGWPAARIEKLLGGNAAHVLTSIWS